MAAVWNGGQRGGQQAKRTLESEMTWLTQHRAEAHAHGFRVAPRPAPPAAGFTLPDGFELPASAKDVNRKLEAALRVFTKLNVDGSGLLDRFDFKAVLEMLQDRQWMPATDPAGRQIFTNSATGESRRDRPSIEEGLDAWLADTFVGAREEPLHVTRSDRV